MDLPEDTSLPLFAYGLFKPRQLGYHRIKRKVRNTTSATVSGELLERDGLPILNGEGHDQVSGFLIAFEKDEAESAYNEITKLEPQKQYSWETKSISLSEEDRVANILLGNDVCKGTTHFKPDKWDGQNDPLFKDALDVVKEVIDSGPEFNEKDMKPFFRLQMAYLLLWTSIERYVSLRYGLRGPHGKISTTKKVHKIAEEDGFREGLSSIDRSESKIYRADKPKGKEKLDPSDPQSSIKYYYQIRNNLSHRGKTAVVDFEKLQKSLRELYNIFRVVLRRAFENAY